MVISGYCSRISWRSACSATSYCARSAASVGLLAIIVFRASASCDAGRVRLGISCTGASGMSPRVAWMRISASRAAASISRRSFWRVSRSTRNSRASGRAISPACSSRSATVTTRSRSTSSARICSIRSTRADHSSHSRRRRVRVAHSAAATRSSAARCSALACAFSVSRRPEIGKVIPSIPPGDPRLGDIREDVLPVESEHGVLPQPRRRGDGARRLGAHPLHAQLGVEEERYRLSFRQAEPVLGVERRGGALRLGEPAREHAYAFRRGCARRPRFRVSDRVQRASLIAAAAAHQHDQGQARGRTDDDSPSRGDNQCDTPNTSPPRQRRNLSAIPSREGGSSCDRK